MYGASAELSNDRTAAMAIDRGGGHRRPWTIAHRERRTLRELPRRLAALPAARCARRSPRSTASRAPPTTSPTKATRARASGSPTWPRTAPTCAATASGRPASRAGRRCSSRWRAAIVATACRSQLLDDLLDAFAQDVTAVRATPTAPSCSTTAAARPTRSAGCCCTCTASATPSALAPLATRSARALQLINFWQDLGVDLPRGRLYLPTADCAATASTRTTLLAGKDSAARRARSSPSCAPGRATLMLRGAPLVHARAGPRRLGAAPGRAGRAAHPRARSTALDGATLQQRPTLGWTDAPAMLGARCACAAQRAARMPLTQSSRAAMTPEQYVQDKAAASGSSFYYAFLFLPPPRRAAITAFYAFCREVDDVVDEVHRPAASPPTKLAWWRRRSRREPSPASRSHPVMQALMPHAAAYGIEPRHLLAVIEGCQMDLEQIALPRLRRPGALLPPGRRRRRRGRGQHLRPARARDHRLRAPARPGDAAHQHHPRRRRRRAPRPHLPAGGRAAAVRRQGARDLLRAPATATASPR